MLTFFFFRLLLLTENRSLSHNVLAKLVAPSTRRFIFAALVVFVPQTKVETVASLGMSQSFGCGKRHSSWKCTIDDIVVAWASRRWKMHCAYEHFLFSFLLVGAFVRLVVVTNIVFSLSRTFASITRQSAKETMKRRTDASIKTRTKCKMSFSCIFTLSFNSDLAKLLGRQRFR